MGIYFRPSAPFTGGTVSGDTYFLGNLSAGTIYSANTPLDLIIDSIASKYSGVTGDFLSLSGGTVTGQTAFNSGLSANTLSGGTIFSGGTNIYQIFATIDDAIYLQNEINQLSGGTSAFTQVSTFNSYTSLTENQLSTKANLSGATFDGQIETPSLSATTITGTNIFGDGSNITGINFSQLATTAHTHPISDVVNLQSNLDSKIDKPINPFLGEYLYYNGITWVPNQLNIPVAAGAGVTLFLSITGSTLPGYEYLSEFPIQKNEVEEQVIVNNSQQLIGKYATNPLKRNIIDPGIWEFNIYASTDISPSGLTQIITNAYLLTTGGSETFLFSAATENITSTAATLYTVSVVETQFSCNTTDYLVINYSGATDNNFNTTVSLYHGGSINYSHIHTPFRTLHNDLAGLQGGQFDEYYHLSKTQVELLTTNVDASSIHNHDSLYLSLGGGTVSGNTEFTQSLSASTIFSAGTNLIDIFAPIVHAHPQYATLSGATFNGQVEAPSLSGTTLSGETYFSGSTPLNTIIQNIASQYSGGTSTTTGNFLPLSGGTVTGNTIFTLGLTGNTAVFSSSTNNVLNIVGSGSTSPIFRVQGSQGELFAVTDSLTGSLFSVNDISGLPVLEAFSDATVLMGNYSAPSLNTTVRLTVNSGTTNIYSIPTSAYTGAFFEYTANDSLNARAGSVMAIFSGTSVQFTEVNTTDIGNTSGITVSVVVSSGNAIFIASATTNSWTVKTIVRSV
jgi:hypothetical protein